MAASTYKIMINLNSTCRLNISYFFSYLHPSASFHDFDDCFLESNKSRVPPIKKESVIRASTAAASEDRHVLIVLQYYLVLLV